MNPNSTQMTEVLTALVTQHADMPGALLPILHAVQAKLGHVPPAAIPVIADGLNLSRAEVHGVMAFYHDFHSEPRGATTIQLCRAEACQAMGSAALETHVKQRLGIDYGGTTADGRYSLEPVYCLGNCACSPSIRMGDEVYARVTATRFDAILDEAD
jgi:formate dehydrogenase subunit gamma